MISAPVALESVAKVFPASAAAETPVVPVIWFTFVTKSATEVLLIEKFPVEVPLILREYVAVVPDVDSIFACVFATAETPVSALTRLIWAATAWAGPYFLLGWWQAISLTQSKSLPKLNSNLLSITHRLHSTYVARCQGRAPLTTNHYPLRRHMGLFVRVSWSLPWIMLTAWPKDLIWYRSKLRLDVLPTTTGDCSGIWTWDFTNESPEQ